MRSRRDSPQIAAESDLRIIGPNCLGLANYALGARISFSEFPVPRLLRAGSVGIASQSGALSQSLAQSIETGVSVSHSFAAGNQADVDVADLVAYLAEDDACRSIVCVFEGMSHPQRLFEAAELAWKAGKPLLVHKIATGQLGSEAAISHTGSLAGSNAAYRAAFERAGVILIDDFEALMEAAAFFAKAPAPKAKGVAVVATSGGAAIMAADKAEEHDVPMPQPSAAATAVLLEHIPDFGSARNPCDVTAQVVNNPQSLWACGEALLSDEQYGAIVMPQPVAFDFHTPRIEALGKLSRDHGKITCNVMISQWLQGPGAREAELNENVAQFRSMDRCFATIAAWHKLHERHEAGPRSWARTSDAIGGRDRTRHAGTGRRHDARRARSQVGACGVRRAGRPGAAGPVRGRGDRCRGGGRLPGRDQGRVAGLAAQDRSRRGQAQLARRDAQCATRTGSSWPMRRRSRLRRGSLACSCSR